MRALLLALLAVPLTCMSASAEEAMKMFERICAEREQAAGPVKCRRHFTSQGYAAQWHGVDFSKTHHGVDIQILTRNDDAVFCASLGLAISDWSMCMVSEVVRPQAINLLETLRHMEMQEPAQPPQGMAREEICAERASDPSSPKCRGHYLSMGYVAQWRGMDGKHPVLAEVLTRDADAVVCFGTVTTSVDASMDALSPCTALQRSAQ